ncbi:MAG: hypothetical protein ACOCQD_03600 [archaeon]
MSYVNKMYRIYFKNNFDELTDDKSRENYRIVEKILESKTTEIQELIYNIIMGIESIPKNIEILAGEMGCEKKHIWNVFEKITKEIASERGLV